MNGVLWLKIFVRYVITGQNSNSNPPLYSKNIFEHNIAYNYSSDIWSHNKTSAQTFAYEMVVVDEENSVWNYWRSMQGLSRISF